MSAQTILDSFDDRTGWDDESKIHLLCQYIENQGDNDCFRDFLEQQADAEDEMGDDEEELIDADDSGSDDLEF
ncbi:MAG TPA: hypothetical protein VN719_04120 [Gemmatimonadales bacterium]|nr:hypothetical protein [Gemmatimonadales bacterium]